MSSDYRYPALPRVNGRGRAACWDRLSLFLSLFVVDGAGQDALDLRGVERVTELFPGLLPGPPGGRM